jgi:hypothetical protein
LQLWGEDFHTELRWGKPERNIPIGRHRHRWENNIKMDLKDVGLSACTGLIGLKRDRW